MTTGRSERVIDAEGVLDGLREALTLAGITLPSLRMHHSTWSASDDDKTSALLDLGAINLDTARQLSSVVHSGRSTVPERGGHT